MAKPIVNMNGKKMTHKLMEVSGIVTGTGNFGVTDEVRLRYKSASGDEMKESWFPVKEVTETVSVRKSAPKKAPAKKAPVKSARKPRTPRAKSTVAVAQS